ncbi:MAG: DUF1574 domain-containing protein [Candidatus Obscuribacterales bacterium]|nr:DUF1574 domain-containing protein [Candidatus Obscuribacterales bacterium]
MQTSIDKPKLDDDMKGENFTGSFVIQGFVCLIALDLLLRFLGGAGYLGFNPLRVSHRSWVYWNEREFLLDAKKDKQEPLHTALFGSSLMMSALHGGDAVYLDKPQNVTLHHKSQLFKDLMEKRSGKPNNNFAFALGGEMVSDAYILFKSMIEQGRGRHPEKLIYGIAPRDFMDHALPSVTSTEIYRYMRRVTDLAEIENRARTGPAEKLEIWLAKLSYIYQHREEFLYLQTRYAKLLCRKLLGTGDLDLVHAPMHIRKQAFLELPEDSAPNEVIVTPPVGPEPYVDNSSEYRNRYRKYRETQFAEQLGYLEKLLKLAKENNVEVILVNMPLTESNMNLMPSGFYQNYYSRVENLAKVNGANLLDLNDHKLFPIEYFGDGVHMNTRGGKRFFEVLVDKLFETEATAR